MFEKEPMSKNNQEKERDRKKVERETDQDSKTLQKEI